MINFLSVFAAVREHIPLSPYERVGVRAQCMEERIAENVAKSLEWAQRCLSGKQFR